VKKLRQNNRKKFPKKNISEKKLQKNFIEELGVLISKKILKIKNFQKT